MAENTDNVDNGEKVETGRSEGLIRGPVQPTDDGDEAKNEEQETTEKIDGRHIKGPNDVYHHRKDNLAKSHDVILKMIQDGVTKRVIHKEMKVSRNTLEAYIRENEDLVEAWKDAQEDLLDLNEEVISELATMDCTMVETENGNFPRFDGRSLATKFNAAKLRLERLGGKRGWNAKIETNEVGNGSRVPIICVGDFSEEELAANKAMVEQAEKEAMEGLEGISHG